MKHKILISIEKGIHDHEFLSDVKRLLNDSHDKLLTGINITNYLEKKLALASGEEAKPRNIKAKVADIEFEVATEQLAAELGMRFSMLKGLVDDSLLNTMSSVADLMIIDRKVLQKYCGDNILSDLVEAVTCPVLILPENRKVESLVMLHDGTLSSVQSVKHFIGLFNRSLREVPVSVLVSEPESKKAIEAEKVFIDYIKLFFQDIGIKLMDDDPINCLINVIQNSTAFPMVIAGEFGGSQLINCTPENAIVTESAPTFIFKNKG